MKNILYFLAILAALAGQPSKAQMLVSVEPDQGMQGQTLSLSISGQGTHFLQATSILVSLLQGTSTIIYAQQSQAISNLLLEATFALSYAHQPGIYDLNVLAQPDGEMVLADAFEIIENPNQPALISVEPNQGETGQTLDLTISGQYTHFQSASTTFWLQQGSSTIYSYYGTISNNTEALARFNFTPSHTPGVYDLKAQNAIDGELTLYNSFNLMQGNQPVIESIEPETGTIGDIYGFDIYGDNTHFDEASVIMAYLKNSSYQTIDLNFTVWTNEHLEGAIIIPYSATAAYYDLHVFNDIDGFMVLPQAVYINENTEQPEILTIDPDSCYVNQLLNVDVYCDNTWYAWSEELYVALKKPNSNERIWGTVIDPVALDFLQVMFDIPLDASGGIWDFIITDDICGELLLEGGMTIIDTITGVSHQNKAEDFKVFPNPGQGLFKITSTQHHGFCTVVVDNQNGQRKIFEKQQFQPNQAVELDIRNLTKGFYSVQIITKENIIIKKLIKQ